MYFVFFNPYQVSVKFNKRDDTIKVIYKLFINDSSYEREAKISQVDDVKYMAVNS